MSLADRKDRSQEKKQKRHSALTFHAAAIEGRGGLAIGMEGRAPRKPTRLNGVKEKSQKCSRPLEGRWKGDRLLRGADETNCGSIDPQRNIVNAPSAKIGVGAAGLVKIRRPDRARAVLTKDRRGTPS